MEYDYSLALKNPKYIFYKKIIVSVITKTDRNRPKRKWCIELARFGIYIISVSVCFGPFRWLHYSVSVCFGPFRFDSVCFGLFWSVSVCFGNYTYPLKADVSPLLVYIFLVLGLHTTNTKFIFYILFTKRSTKVLTISVASLGDPNVLVISPMVCPVHL